MKLAPKIAVPPIVGIGQLNTKQSLCTKALRCPLRESELVSNVSQTQGTVLHDILHTHQESLWQLVEHSAEVLSSNQQQQLYQVLLA